MKEKKLYVLGPANSPHIRKWITPFIDEFDITLLTFHPPLDELEFPGIRLVLIPRSTSTKADYLLSSFWLRKYFCREKAKFIHVHYVSSYGISLLLTSQSIKRIATVWGSDLLMMKKRLRFSLLNLLITRFLKNIEWLNVPSEQTYHHVLSLGVDPDKVEVFQYGVDLDEFEKYRTSKNQDRFTIISTRAWASLYNIDVILKAFVIAWRKRKDLELIVTGWGSEDKKQQLHNLAEGCPSILIKGKLKREELITELWRANAFVSIPSSDGMPLSVMEAMYCECYPILSNLPPNRELIEGREGVIVEDLSVEKLAEAFLQIKRSKSNNSNSNYIRKHGNYMNNIERLRRVYEALLV